MALVRNFSFNRGAGTAVRMRASTNLLRDVTVDVSGRVEITYGGGGECIATVKGLSSFMLGPTGTPHNCLYYSTAYANRHNRCFYYALSVAASPHHWREGSGTWRHNLGGWKGGVYPSYCVRYNSLAVEPACDANGGGSGRTNGDLTFNLGVLPAHVTRIYIGVTGQFEEPMYGVWLPIDIPLRKVESPVFRGGGSRRSICLGKCLHNLSFAVNTSMTGLSWVLQISDNDRFQNYLEFGKFSDAAKEVAFENIDLPPATRKYWRVRVTSGAATSDWVSGMIETCDIPRPDTIVEGISDEECFNLQHGIVLPGTEEV